MAERETLAEEAASGTSLMRDRARDVRVKLQLTRLHGVNRAHANHDQDPPPYSF